MRHAYYGHLTREEAKRAAEEGYVLVLPVGAIEQHGPHLPIDADDYQAMRGAQEGVEEAREKYGAKVLLLPGVHYGNSFVHHGFPGHISLRFETFISVVYDILDQLIGEGFRRFVLANGNGGNRAGLTIATRKVTEKWRQRGVQVFIYIVHVGEFEGPPMPDGFAEKVKQMIPRDAKGGYEGEHAGVEETAQILAGREELVRQDRLVRPKVKAIRWSNARIDEISDTGATSDPTQACKEVGELFWRTFRVSFAKMLAEISQGTAE